MSRERWNERDKLAIIQVGDMDVFDLGIKD